MDIVESKPKSFLEYVAETHVDRYLCPEADELRQTVEAAFYKATRGRDPNGNPIWLSRGWFTTRVKAKSVTFSVSTPRLRRKIAVEDQVIALIADGDLLSPVAFILPAPDIVGVSASVVVVDTVNDPQHLQELMPIIETIRRNASPGPSY